MFKGRGTSIIDESVLDDIDDWNLVGNWLKLEKIGKEFWIYVIPDCMINSTIC